MEFDAWLEEAANYLESDGISYESDLDDKLHALWKSGVQAHDVAEAFRKSCE